MLLSSHTFSFIAYSLRHGHRFKDNSIPPLPYPKALARLSSYTPTIRYRPHYLTLATFYKVSLTAPQPSVPFSYHLRRKDETPNMVTLTNRYSLRNLAESIQPNLISRLLYDRIQPRMLLSLSFIKIT